MRCERPGCQREAVAPVLVRIVTARGELVRADETIWSCAECFPGLVLALEARGEFIGADTSWSQTGFVGPNRAGRRCRRASA
jgi:hypothetical protein